MDVAVACLCRLCASKSDNYVNVYEEEGQKLNLASKITQCLQIWLYPEDILPKTVCVECCTKVDQCFDFFELCSQSQISLMAIFNEKKSDVNKLSNGDVSNELDIIKKLSNDDNEEDFNDNVANNDFDNIDEDDELENEDEYDNGHADNQTRNNNENDSDEEAAGENPDFSVECVLTAKRGTSRRKLRMPIKRSSKELINTHNNKIIKKRPSRRCTIKNEKKLKPKPGVNSINGKVLHNKSNEKVKINDNMIKIESNNDVESNDNDDDDDDDDDDGGGGEEEENAENIKQVNSNRRLMDGYSWKCTDCSAELKTLSALKEHHQVLHNQAPNFKCTHCTKVYTRYRSFARHIKLHSNPKKFSCEVCGKSFSQKTVLQSHSTVHSEERPHVCPQCGKAFKQFSSLYLHSKCHLPEEVKPKFPCTVCPKQFSTKHTLETHMKIHTGERNFICDICGKSFIAKGSLDYHILAHNDAKPHNCAVCGKGFKTVRLLSKHATLHTGIKPHQCDVCGKQFRERSALKEHNRIHTGAMPYSCEYCGKLFRFKGILTVHRRQHTGERPYSCSDCRREFTNWANYNKHMKRRHRNVENNSSSPRIMIDRGIQSSSQNTLSHSQSQSQSTTEPLHQPEPQHLISISQSDPQDQLPPQISVQQLTPVTGIQLHMQSPAIFNDNNTTNSSDSNSYKILPDDNTSGSINGDIYRVSHYLPPNATLSSMSYYIPPIHQPAIHSRNQ